MSNINLIDLKPKNLNEFFLNPKIIEFLNLLINLNKLNILIVGESGSGKTSLIECLAESYYNLFYKNNENINKEYNLYSDKEILLLNPLKEQGIAFFRNEIKIFCQTIYKNSIKKKLLIVDDIDLISDQNQHIYRNYLDLYENNLNFICSCTNIEKVLNSIQSRLFIIKFEQCNTNNLYTLIDKLTNIFKIKIDRKFYGLIVNNTNFCKKSLICLIQKIKLIDEEISEEKINILCTDIIFKDLETYINLCRHENNLSKCINILISIYENGYSVIDILTNLFSLLKINKNIEDIYKYKITKLISKYICIFYINHEDLIELIFFTKNLIQIFN